eukprot:9398242-Karenia_brevis.AAC.1
MPGCEGRQGEFKDIPGPERCRKAKINVMNIWKLHHDHQLCTHATRAMRKPTMNTYTLQPPSFYYSRHARHPQWHMPGREGRQGKLRHIP